MTKNQFLTEIMEQPAAIGNIIAFYSGAEGMALLAKIKETIAQRAISRVIFTGMGSPFFISFAAANLFLNSSVPTLIFVFFETSS